VESVEASSSMSGPLAGIRVLDLTSVVLGPLATQVLGDHGASVIKVESLDGDSMRANGAARNPGMGSIFLSINRNKRSLAIDLKRAEGREIIRRLVADVDVLVHNMRVPAIDRLGLGYEAVRELNPQIVFCAATGFGQDGPDRYKPAFDDIIQAACGIASLVGAATGRPEYAPTLLADKIAGLAVSSAVFAALFHRERTGEGQYVEVPMYETLVEFTLSEHLGGMAFDPAVGAAGYSRILSGGRRPSQTADGFVAMLPYSPDHWRRIFERVGRQDLLAGLDLTDRVKVNAVVRNLYDLLNEITPSLTSEQWEGVCAELDIPISRIYSIEELPKHPHLEAVGLFQTMDHPTQGRVRYLRPAARFSNTPLSVRDPAPELGADTQDILVEAGYGETEIADFIRAGIVRASIAEDAARA
jgi:crotonobetainyl-CoA:carnitine CoA-transferase CaiB-like acyl-CoA transferase